MEIIPAIDLYQAQCVRLRQGSFKHPTVYSHDPAAMAKKWVDQGASRLHVVDLDGALHGVMANRESILRIREALPDHIMLQVGGGIRDMASAGFYLDNGVDYAIIGTRAIQSPDFVADLCQSYPGRIYVGIDARDGWVAIEGWSETSSVKALDLALSLKDKGVGAIIYTDIARDGMMEGIQEQQYNQLTRTVQMPVIASGGISGINDLLRLQALRNPYILGAIVGRALYEGNIDLPDALSRSREIQASPESEL